MALICIAPPQLEPVSLDELKAMLRLDPTDTTQDSLISNLAVAARAYCETVTQRRFVKQTWRLALDFFPGFIDMKLAGQKVSSPFVSGSNAVLVGIRYAIALPFPPVQNIASFTYQDANGTVSTMTTDNYVADLLSQPARIMPVFGQMWPVARVVANAVQVEYVCGYASPFTFSTTAGNRVITGTFSRSNIGQPVYLPGAQNDASTLSTIIQSVDLSGNATVRDVPLGTVSNGQGLIVDNGSSSHFELARTAIRVLTNLWFVSRVPTFDAATRDCVAAVLGPCTDLRL